MFRSLSPFRIRLFTLAAVMVVASAVAGPALAAPAHATGKTVKVAASEFKFVLSTKTAPAGKITFSVVNKGHIAHDFKIDGKKTPLLQPGKTATLTVTLKAGKYPYLCTVPGHAAAGMKGTFIVT
jgi:uncharacterized cupredoxin-like copper-binding protein